MAETPNFLVIIADQLVADLTGVYGHPVVRTPNMERLAARGVRFDSAYCPYPVCSPSRSSMLSGRYASTNSAWDNAAPISSDLPMLPHYLSIAGYDTALSGKMHFVGADQLHGFEKRLTTDMFPSTLAWTPDRDAVGRFVHPGNPEGPPIAIDYVDAGPVQWTDQLQFDEETHYRAVEYLRSKRTRPKGSLQVPQPPAESRPWLLVASYHHPHEPFLAPQRYWDLYEDADIELVTRPASPDLPRSAMDAWVDTLHGVDGVDLEDDDAVYRMRRAYYALVTYIDDKVGELLDVLDETGHADDTVIILTSDHGDMLGERGMVQKRAFYEWSARVPFIVAGGPVSAAGTTVDAPVSLLDVLPTVCDLVGITPVDTVGTSLAPRLEGEHEPGTEVPVFVEYHSEGVYAPCWLRREGTLKYVYIHGHGEQLFDLADDPGEERDLSGDPAWADEIERMRADLLSRFDPDDIEARIRRSITDRKLVRRAMAATGTMWTYDPDPALFTQYWRET
ncbi:choline-sulfatase [Agromyces aerolatus]|uniref:choline-sulfatase n=1 Tax=Agromyces sp. LY-1074 TaxID=3074080 RepID=UPI00285BADC5|nr:MULTISPECIES: choline-sulfatase [unclassified Agromyces]MDR5700909.1 choline-sulfatase [Agromyces sp. LY-1074]MDR5707430.1 choline-sulfatase [Agromyces sp. LY-1358]